MAINDSMMLRIVLSKDIHKQLKLKSVEYDTTMQAIIEELVIDWLKKNEKPKRERYSLRGRAKGGEPIPKEAIDEAIREFNKIEKEK
ncbi:hypothetical protein FJZ33_11320 [Candidatus Poribacteria bacterium]|nr:hypothetical protein [Candidatus Poribacteria bacterium]